LEKTIKLNSDEEAIALYGKLDERLMFAEEKFKVRVTARNFKLSIIGTKENVSHAYEFFSQELERIRKPKGEGEGERAFVAPVDLKRENSDGPKEPISFFHKGKLIKPKGANQEAYVQAIYEYDIVICIGPAGTGKTYLAMASALDALKRKKVSRIILTRPAVEAGESLGFLPGDLYAKINPYLRPLYDALYEMMDFDEATRYLQRGTIEVAPLAYMRGRTLNDSFVILDEAQNCTHEQMKMFLTRLGFSSRAVLTGDITQTDLPRGKPSGLIEIQNILHNIRGIKFCYLNDKDVVRHRLVQDIIKAYEKHEKKM
jgi:phosphate starvation-inducible PhoH-like protein